MERPPTPVFLPEFHGQRSLMGYSSWDHKESDRTERLTLSLSLFFFNCLESLEPWQVWGGREQTQPEVPKNWSWRWSLVFMLWKSTLEVSSAFRAAWVARKDREGVDWKRIGSRDLQTLQGEGGAKRRLCQPSSLLPHSAQGCVFGLYLFSR